MHSKQERSRSTFRGGQGFSEIGLTLIEMAIVVAVIGILVAVVTVAVRGTGNTARAAAKATDIVEVQKAVNAYHGLHPQEGWPTLGKQVGAVALRAGSVPAIPFSSSNPESFVAIDWDATFATPLEGTKSLVPHFLPRSPKHSLEVTLDVDGDGTPEQPEPTRVWVLERGGVVRVLLDDAKY